MYSIEQQISEKRDEIKLLIIEARRRNLNTSIASLVLAITALIKCVFFRGTANWLILLSIVTFIYVIICFCRWHKTSKRLHTVEKEIHNLISQM